MASEEEFEGEAMIMIHASAEKNHLTTMKIFIEKWKWDLHARDINGRTPLHTAVAHGNLEMVKYLIEKRANVNAPDYSRDTPLHVAVSPPVPRDSLEIEILKYLIKNGANLNARGRDNYTPLHIAVLCIGNSCGIITMKTLIEAGADVNIPNYNGDTALHTANRMRHTSLEKLLIETGADPNIKNKKGETCLNTKV